MNFTEKQKTEIAFIIVEYCKFHKIDQLDEVHLRRLAYILATVQHETAGTFLPVEEYGKGKKHLYGVPNVAGRAFYGRGYVQLTWLSNYKVMSEKLNENLVLYPEKALDKDIALKIMFVGMDEGLFTGKKLSQYFNDVCEDPISARKIINGKDKAKQIAELYRNFKKYIVSC